MTGYTVIDDIPSTRFPVYTRGNAGEVYPNVMTPLSGTLIGDAAPEGQRRAMLRLGLLVERDFDEDGSASTGIFGGYLYGNLSVMRVASERVPGMTALDGDRQVAGLTTDAPPHRARAGDRCLRATVKASAIMGSRMLRPSIAEVDAARAETERWRASVPDPSTRSDDELVDFARAYSPRFADRMCQLLAYSGFAAAGSSTVEKLADRAGAPPGTAAALTAGLGTIDSADPAVRLWELGRLVASSAELTPMFDAGVAMESLTEAAGSPDADGFLEALGRFVEAHGHRGPDEWELASPTWGTDPQIALAAVDRLRLAPDERDPLAARRRLVAQRADAIATVRAQLPRPMRRAFDRAVRAAHLYAEGRERAKAVFVADLFPLRQALIELADRTRSRGGPEERRDFFLITSDELRDFVADPIPFRSVIEERRAVREYLQARVPPFVFEGELPDPATWPLRDEVRIPSTNGALAGQGVCPGVARGTARIVRDPADPGMLEPGDILVAPITDPAWTPLFLAVAGVVVEVGAQQSHAAIVARELGIPAIVGVADATVRLADGDPIEIDGATGTVTKL